MREPKWWYEAETTFAARALGPIADVWGEAAERRYRAGAAFRPGLPVICVGNFTIGGTGKTPLAIHIAEEIAALGACAAFLTRGYKGRRKGPHWVDPGRDSALDVGDEPLLLARTGPTVVARDREAGARAIAAASARVGAIVMDDGLQNGAVAKDLAIAVVDGGRGFGNGAVMPAGPLRARLAFQLGLADMAIVNVGGAGEPSPPVAAWLAQHIVGPVLRAWVRPNGDVSFVDGQPVVAFSGIGNPERFFGLAERRGAKIVERRAFPDHHVFQEREAAELLACQRKRGALLLTTEKDWVRLPHGGGALGALKDQAKAFGIRVEMAADDRQRLRAKLARLLGIDVPA